MMFYVYVHRRADTGAPFYVGKGKAYRCNVLQHRSKWWRAVVAKAGGFQSQIVARIDDEELALLAEVEQIAKFRALGVVLTNLTDGGEGMSGFKWDAERLARRAEAQRGQSRPTVSAKLKGVPKTAEHRAKLAAAKRGVPASESAKAKMSATRKGRPSAMVGKKHTEEAKAKIAAGLLRHYRGAI